LIFPVFVVYELLASKYSLSIQSIQKNTNDIGLPFLKQERSGFGFRDKFKNQANERQQQQLPYQVGP
jgi:hypothetical protein